MGQKSIVYGVLEGVVYNGLGHFKTHPKMNNCSKWSNPSCRGVAGGGIRWNSDGFSIGGISVRGFSEEGL